MKQITVIISKYDSAVEASDKLRLFEEYYMISGLSVKKTKAGIFRRREWVVMLTSSCYNDVCHAIKTWGDMGLLENNTEVTT